MTQLSDSEKLARVRRNTQAFSDAQSLQMRIIAQILEFGGHLPAVREAVCCFLEMEARILLDNCAKDCEFNVADLAERLRG